jgi:hypothetical protein
MLSIASNVVRSQAPWRSITLHRCYSVSKRSVQKILSRKPLERTLMPGVLNQYKAGHQIRSILGFQPARYFFENKFNRTPNRAAIGKPI